MRRKQQPAPGGTIPFALKADCVKRRQNKMVVAHNLRSWNATLGPHTSHPVYNCVFFRLRIMPIRLIVGLGNPGPEYEQTRHNAGFWLVDNLANTLPGTRLQRETRYHALMAKTAIGGRDVWLLEPLTFMNRSGQSVGALAGFFKIAAEDILVVHDELDLAPGVARLKQGGSSGGHNGLKDITAALGTQNYWRLRLGIGHPRTLGLQQGVADFVLHRPRKEEQPLIEEAITRSLAVIDLLVEGKFPAATMQLHTVT
jgi:PTH1 family peptidyl-tRNA hydrolase